MDPTHFIAHMTTPCQNMPKDDTRTVDAFYAQHGRGFFARIAHIRRRLAQARTQPKHPSRFARPAQVR